MIWRGETNNFKSRFKHRQTSGVSKGFSMNVLVLRLCDRSVFLEIFHRSIRLYFGRRKDLQAKHFIIALFFLAFLLLTRRNQISILIYAETRETFTRRVCRSRVFVSRIVIFTIVHLADKNDRCFSDVTQPRTHLIFLSPRDTLTSRRCDGLLFRKALKQQISCHSSWARWQVFRLPHARPDIFLGRAEEERVRSWRNRWLLGFQRNSLVFYVEDFIFLLSVDRRARSKSKYREERYFRESKDGTRWIR